MDGSTLRLILSRFVLSSALAFAGAAAARAQNARATPHHIGVEGDHFVLDGKPLQIISGELHYARIPREYWRDRLRKARGMGLNAISTFFFWDVHQPSPGG